jgi:polyhydroxyalkanoate synthesis regulator phasin
VAEYRARAKAALVAAETAVRAAAEDAVSVVADLMRDADTDAVRLRAALSVLEIARNVSVEELEERIEALEQGAR